MSQATEVDHWQPNMTCDSSRPRRPLDSKRVCEIVGEVGAEVLAEVRAGTWRPPTTLCVGSRPRGPMDGDDDRTEW